ncbi:MAG: nicotinate-nucleotide adenylyltransferase [bacterium]
MKETRGLFDQLRIGLLGGSFNPPHQGHLEISLQALHRLQLDFVWWLVTPGNPLKQQSLYADYSTRLKAAETLATHPKIIVSDYEDRHKLRYTVDTISQLHNHFPTSHFVWLMGADNLAQFHQWRQWRTICATLPIAVFNRPGSTLSTLSAPAAHYLANARRTASAARQLAECPAPAWTFIKDSYNAASSTQLRKVDPDWPQNRP